MQVLAIFENFVLKRFYVEFIIRIFHVVNAYFDVRLPREMRKFDETVFFYAQIFYYKFGLIVKFKNLFAIFFKKICVIIFIVFNI
jgi:hypothetical protein